MSFADFVPSAPRRTTRRPRLVVDNPTVTRTPASPPVLRVVSTTTNPTPSRPKE